MGRTTIEWTDASWNPLVGCSEVSPGCANCYAARLAATRLRNLPDYKNLAAAAPGGRPRWLPGAVKLLPDRLHEPLSWKKPRRIFVCDMGDLFHEAVPDEFIRDVFRVMALGGGMGHVFQVLTKRAKRMQDFMRADHGVEWVRPMPWLWLGVSVENQRFAEERIPLLLQTPAAVRFISAEPLLGPIEDLFSLSGRFSLPLLDWVICGGESGANARPMYPAWARSLQSQCHLVGTPFFFKQWGEWIHAGQIEDAFHAGELNRLSMNTRCRVIGEDIFFRVGKKRAGRKLDGREYSEFPC